MVILNRSETEFWKLTPREFDSLIRVHISINTPKDKKGKVDKPLGFIDQVL